jgi:hypothetical protein
MYKFVIFLIANLICNISFAQTDSSSWQRSELTENFMQNISKEQCMNKTINSLTEYCKADACFKTMAGVLGDCLTWSKGSSTTYCNNYDLNYTKQCFENKLDGRSCLFVNFMKDQYCKIPLAELEENTKNLTPLQVFVSFNLLGEWSSDCSKGRNQTVNKAAGSMLISEAFIDGVIVSRALYANVKIVDKNSYTYTAQVYNKKDELIRIVSGVTQVLPPSKQKQLYLEVKPVTASSATILIENGKSVASSTETTPIVRCSI